MMPRTQEEIDQLIDSGEMDKMIERSKARIASDSLSTLTIEGEALILLARTARHPDATDEQIDTAVAAARQAGHTWAEIEPVLHATRPGAIAG